jgi:tetratricopeptide (TPR) repeat protein
MEKHLVSVHKLLNLVLVLQGKHEEAIRHYTAALALDKWRPEIWTSRGMAYYCVGEYESAVRDFTRYMAATQRGLLSELIQTDIYLFVIYVIGVFVSSQATRHRCFSAGGVFTSPVI